MLTQKQYRSRAKALLGSFVAVLVLIFLPIYPDLQPGKRTDGLTFMDNFFNSLSKYSSDFMEDQRDKVRKAAPGALDAALTIKPLKDAKDKNKTLIPAETLAADAARVLTAAGFEATAEGASLKVKGDCGKLLESAIADAELMYKNDGAAISAKYAGMNERAAVFAWYNTVTALAANFKKSGQTAQANLVSGVAAKTLEPAYNYYQIEAKSRTKYLFPLLLALGFYVLYTCWYGFGILYLFESMGVKLEH